MINRNIFHLIIIFLCACNLQNPIITGEEGKTLPDFKIQLDFSRTYNSRDIGTGKPIVLLSFKTNCPYCRAEIEEILNDIDNMKDFRFYFVSSDTLPVIQKFIKQYNLKGYLNIITGCDTGRFLNKYFKSEGVPFTAIYSKDKKLNAAFLGKIGTKEIRKYSEDSYE